MGFFDDLLTSSSNSNDGHGHAFASTNDGYNSAKNMYVERFNSGKSIDYSDPGLKRVLTAFGARSVEELRHKDNL